MADSPGFSKVSCYVSHFKPEPEPELSGSGLLKCVIFYPQKGEILEFGASRGKMWKFGASKGEIGEIERYFSKSVRFVMQCISDIY